VCGKSGPPLRETLAMDKERGGEGGYGCFLASVVR